MWNAISLVQDLNSCRRVHFQDDNDYTTWISDNQNCYNVYIYIYIYMYIVTPHDWEGVWDVPLQQILNCIWWWGFTSKLWEVWGIPSLTLPSSPLWVRIVVIVRVLSMGQMDLFKYYLYLIQADFEDVRWHDVAFHSTTSKGSSDALSCALKCWTVRICILKVLAMVLLS